MKKISSNVVWLTGMSGSGKSTLANMLQNWAHKTTYSISVVDGDFIRDSYNNKLGFGMSDVRINNTRIASKCNEDRMMFDLVIVPVISPYEKVRQEVRSMLEPNFHLIYLKTDIDSLKERDVKGLYAAADRGEINGLIGYSDEHPYNEPNNAELIIPTGSNTSLNKSFNLLLEYVKKYL